MPRPSYKPTARERAVVKSLAVLGISHEEICSVVRLRSPKTLRKCYARELAHGLAEAIAVVSETAYQMAMSGHHLAMTIFWLKCQVPTDESLNRPEEENGMRQPSRVVMLEKPQGREEQLDAAA
jgi:hypothetical protein